MKRKDQSKEENMKQEQKLGGGGWRHEQNIEEMEQQEQNTGERETKIRVRRHKNNKTK